MQIHLLALRGGSSSPARMLSSRSSEALLVSASFLMPTGLAAQEYGTITRVPLMSIHVEEGLLRKTFQVALANTL